MVNRGIAAADFDSVQSLFTSHSFYLALLVENIWLSDYGNLLLTIRAMLIWADAVFGYTETVTLNQRLVAVRAVGIFIRVSGHVSYIYIL